MRGRPRVAILALCLAACALAAPAGAVAKKGGFSLPGSFTATVRLPGSNHYRLGLEAKNHRQLVLTVGKRRHEGTATYTAPARIGSRGIKADFGRFGHVSLNFEARQVRHRTLSAIFDKVLGCKGPAPTSSVGVFHGSIRFRGEGGYVHVSTGTAPGRIVVEHKQRCAPLTPPRRKAMRRLAKKAGAKEPALSVQLFLVKSFAGGRLVQLSAGSIAVAELINIPILSARILEKVGPVHVLRMASDLEAIGSALLSPAGVKPETATIAGPAPFHGTGMFSRPPGGRPTWRGDLAVDLPGAPTQALTGPQFHTVVLCRPENVKGIEECGHRHGPEATPAGSAEQVLRELRAR